MYVGLSLYLTNVIGFSDRGSGSVMGYFRLLSALSPIACDAVADRITFKRSLIVAFTLYAASYLALFAFPSKSLAVASLAGIGIGRCETFDVARRAPYPARLAPSTLPAIGGAVVPSTPMQRLAGVAVLLAALGCGSPLSQAKGDFKKGRYADARRGLVAVERDSRAWDDARRAEYALYRGLTHGALGDREAAAVWLHEAKALEDARPGSLSADDAARLRLALESHAVEP